MLRRQKHAFSQSTTPFACTLFTSENQGNALRQDFPLFIECKTRVLIRWGCACMSAIAHKVRVVAKVEVLQHVHGLVHCTWG